MQQMTKDPGPEGSHIPGMPQTTMDQIKQQLLMCIEREPMRNTQKKVCDAVGQLAVNLLAHNLQAWPELGPFILGATSGGNPQLHEAAFTILNALAEFIAEKWCVHAPSLGLMRLHANRRTHEHEILRCRTCLSPP
eukprot:6199564-Pleurochrysis_carterae.AAC.1